jgi:hypothetical protein
MLDVLLEEAEGDSWHFRRQPSIARPLVELGAHTSRGVPFIRPEIALLYKAKHLRFKDQRDFDVSAPGLDATARAWLAAALERRTRTIGGARRCSAHIRGCRLIPTASAALDPRELRGAQSAAADHRRRRRAGELAGAAAAFAGRRRGCRVLPASSMSTKVASRRARVAGCLAVIRRWRIA